MRIIQPAELEKLWNEVEPYLIPSLNGSSFKEGTPETIMKKYAIWKAEYKKLFDE